jgi:hypothetical protein
MPAIRHICPHCKRKMRTITSKQLSDLVREIYVDCMNVDCGHRAVVQQAFIRTLVPSLIPSPDVRLPIVERRANDIIVPSAKAGADAIPPASPKPPSSEAGSTRYLPMALN